MGTDETEMEVDERLKLGEEDEHGDDSDPEKEQFLDAKPHDDEEEDSSGSSSSSGDGDDRDEEDEQDEDDEEGEDSHGSPNREENGQFAEQNGDGKNLELPEKSNKIDYDEVPNHDNISEGDDRPLATNILEKTPVPYRKPVARTSYEFSGLAGSNSAKKQKMIEDEDTGTIEEQAEFMRELEIFHKERNLDFKAPKFYQEPLNLLKLWSAVIRLGGYDRVTGQKLWRQVGESFHPPKTCTTVSWTFRIFYEKALLEYEKYKREIGEIEFPDMPVIEPTSVEIEGGGYPNSGSGRARRESATRAMQGWHVQRLIGFGEVGEPIIKDKNLSAAQKREKNLKSIGGSKQKRSAQDPAENHFHDRELRTLNSLLFAFFSFLLLSLYAVHMIDCGGRQSLLRLSGWSRLYNRLIANFSTFPCLVVHFSGWSKEFDAYNYIRQDRDVEHIRHVGPFIFS